MLREYKSFNEFSKKADDIAGLYDNIDDIRKAFKKEILHSYINLGNLSKEAKKLLKSDVDIVKLSLDTFIKNKMHHRDISINEYKLIPEMLKNPDKLAKSKK